MLSGTPVLKSEQGGSVPQISAEALRHRCRKVICDTAVAYLLPLFRFLKSEKFHRCDFSLSRGGKNDTAVVFSSKAKENQIRKPESVVQKSEQQKPMVKVTLLLLFALSNISQIRQKQGRVTLLRQY